MLIDKFKTDKLVLGDAQFAVALALSQLGESVASSAVLEFMGTNANAYKGTECLACRAKIQNEIRESGQDLVFGLVEYLNTNAVIRIKRAGITVQTGNVRLVDLLEHNHSTVEIYTRAMTILRKTGVKKLLVTYMDTAEYQKVFEKDVRTKHSLSADGYRLNDLSTGIVNEIRDDFKKFVERSSSNGTYNPASGTPLAYLRNTFNMFYGTDRHSKFAEILNTKGTNYELGGSNSDNDLSFIDFNGIEATDAKAEIDFINLASRIQRASFLIFSHARSDIAFLDIFSCCRDEQLRMRLIKEKEAQAKNLRGCTFNYVDSAEDMSGGNADTVRNKKVSRVGLCKIFSPIVTKGISQKEVLDYYRKAIVYTDNLPTTKDGTHLFNTPNFTTKHVENNSQMLQIIISGFLALKELVEYLQRDDVPMSVYNFPTIIFRNKDYLRRFQDIDEYVSYINTVAPLVEEVRSDSSRKVARWEGIASNDVVWEYLGASNLMHDKLFKKLADMPLGYITNAVRDSQVLSQDKIFERDFSKMRKNLETLSEMYEEKYIRVGGLQYRYNALKGILQIMRDPRFKGMSNAFQYATAFGAYMSLRELLDGIECHPVCDANGKYLYYQNNALEEMQNVQGDLKDTIEVRPDIAEAYKTQPVIRALLISQIYQVFTGIELENGYVLEQREFYNFWYTGTVLLKIFSTMCGRMEEITQDVRGFENSAFLVIASVARDPAIFELPQNIVSCDELAFLFDATTSSHLLSDLSVEEIEIVNRDRDRVLLKAVNKFLAIFGEEYNSFALAGDLLDKYVSKKYEPIAVETVADRTLKRMAEKAHSFEFTMSVPATVRNQLQALAPTDESGYLMVGNERFCLDAGRSFILDNGVIVILTPTQEDATFSCVSETDIMQLKNQIDFHRGVRI